MAIERVCIVCGKKYKACDDCDKLRNLHWKHVCCSRDCFRKYIESDYEGEADKASLFSEV